MLKNIFKVTSLRKPCRFKVLAFWKSLTCYCVQNDKKKILSSKAAFTLAEVLITLSILGIIAAVAIPSIKSHFRKNQVEVKLKETYAILENVIEIAKLENGGLINMFNNANNDVNYFAENYIVPYLNYIETCNTRVDYRNCKTVNHYYITLINGKNDGGGYYITNNKYRITLKNGASVMFWFYSEQLYIIVDVNGNSGKNRFGYDTFYLSLHKPGTGNCINPNNNNNCNKGNNISASATLYESSDKGAYCTNDIDSNRYCAAVIKRNGWKIPDNYPVKF